MKTINQIGKAALLKIFKPESRFNAMEQFYRGVNFPEVELDILIPIKKSYTNVHYGEIQYRSGRVYKAWGIELGLIGLEIQDGKNIFDSIIGLKSLPSHLIVKDWSACDINGEREDFEIYRLSQEQENALRLACR